MRCARVASIALAALFAATSAQALTIDFESRPNGEAGPFQVTFPGLTVDVSADVPPPGDHAGLAIFDSDPAGPNAGGDDADLLVDTGNILILQNGDAPYTTQTVPGIFDTPNDDEDGGIFYFDFNSPVFMASIDLIDINAGGMLSVILRDGSTGSRTYLVPNGWTGDVAAGDVGIQTLDLTTLADQIGVGPGMLIATASESAGFDANDVVQVEINFGGSAAVDNVTFIPEPGTAMLVGLGLAAMGARRRSA
jgi:hypothetical protein